MIRLKILSGKQAGGIWSARHFPVRVGRSPQSDLTLGDDGIWDEHLEINLDSAQGFVLVSKSEGGISVNGQSVSKIGLRNGDIIELGSAKLQFWLGEVSQRGLLAPEYFIWALAATVSLGQIAVIYWLLD